VQFIRLLCDEAFNLTSYLCDVFIGRQELKVHDEIVPDVFPVERFTSRFFEFEPFRWQVVECVREQMRPSSFIFEAKTFLFTFTVDDMGCWICSLNEFRDARVGCELRSTKTLDEVRRGGRPGLETGLMSVRPLSGLPCKCLD